MRRLLILLFLERLKGRLLILVFLLLVACATAAAAQTPTGTPSSKLLVDEVATDLPTVQAFTFAYYPDTATTPTPIAMTCAGAASPFTCSGAFPAFTPGAHSLVVTAKNAAGESPKSPVLSFTFVLIPNAPQNIRIGDDELADADYVLWGAVSVAPARGQER